MQAAEPRNDTPLVSLKHYHQAHDSEQNLLEPWVFAQEDCHVSHERDEAHHAADEIFFSVQVLLTGSIETHIIRTIGIALCQEL